MRKTGSTFPHDALEVRHHNRSSHGSGRPGGTRSPQPFLALHPLRSAASAGHRLEHRLVRDPQPHGGSARRLDRGGGARRTAMDLRRPHHRRLPVPHRDHLQQPRPEARRHHRLLRAHRGGRPGLSAAPHHHGGRGALARQRRQGHGRRQLGPAAGQHQRLPDGRIAAPVACRQRAQGEHHGARHRRDRRIRQAPGAPCAAQPLARRPSRPATWRPR